MLLWKYLWTRVRLKTESVAYSGNAVRKTRLTSVNPKPHRSWGMVTPRGASPVETNHRCSAYMANLWHLLYASPPASGRGEDIVHCLAEMLEDRSRRLHQIRMSHVQRHFNIPRSPKDFTRHILFRFLTRTYVCNKLSIWPLLM